MSGRFWSKIIDLLKPEEGSGGEEVIFEGDSPYHHIIIRDAGDLRTLYFGPDGEEAETSINLAHPREAVFEYPGMMLAALPLQPEGQRVVMIGLGGGFLAGLFQDFLPRHQLTVVELDILVAELAQTYFGFTPGGNVRLVVGDGRDFLTEQEDGGLDQIWLDAFSGRYVPPQLSGREFLELCRDRLTPGGLLVQNLHQSQNRIFHNQLKTTEAVFGSFLALDGQRCGNAVVIARKPGETPGPAWKTADLAAAAKKFGRRVGPYDLAAEMAKIKNFTIDPAAEIIK